MALSEGGGGVGSGVMVEVQDSGVQREEFLRSSPKFKAKLAAFLLPGHSVCLFHEVVAAGGGDHLDVLHTVEYGNLP